MLVFVKFQCARSWLSKFVKCDETCMHAITSSQMQSLPRTDRTSVGAVATL